MKPQKYLLLVTIILFEALPTFAQQWVTDEVYAESLISDPITILDVLYSIFIVFLIWCSYKLYGYLKTIDKKNFNILLKRICLGLLCTAIFLPMIILTFFDLKRANLEKKATESLTQLIDNAGAWMELNGPGIVYFEEIEPYLNQVPSSEIDKSPSRQKLIKEFGVKPYEGVYRCFDIRCGCEPVVFAKEAKYRGFSSESNPVLFYGNIEPYRIRYFSNSNVNPYRDLKQVYHTFIQHFIWKHDVHQREDIGNTFFGLSLNEYFCISTISGGDEMWAKNKIYYENDIIQERSYEYKTINYGNFDITYCISSPCKMGICEKFYDTKFLGIRFSGEVHLVKRNITLLKCGIVWLFVASLLLMPFCIVKKREDKDL